MVAKTTEGVDSFMVKQENSFKVCHNLMRSLCVGCLSSIRFYITVDVAGVGERKVMQKGAFAYKGEEKCVIHKNLLQRFNNKRMSL